MAVWPEDTTLAPSLAIVHAFSLPGMLTSFRYREKRADGKVARDGHASLGIFNPFLKHPQ